MSRLLVVALAAWLAACGTTEPTGSVEAATAATPAPTVEPTASPTAVPTAAPTATPPPLDALALDGFAGRWTFSVADPEVVVAAGAAAEDGVAALDGDRWRFAHATGGAEGAIELHGTIRISCGDAGCPIETSALTWRIVRRDAGFVIESQVDGLPYGVPRNTDCDWGPRAGAGVIEVTGTGVIDGGAVATAFRFASWGAQGTGDRCSQSLVVVRWTTTASRLP